MIPPSHTEQVTTWLVPSEVRQRPSHGREDGDELRGDSRAGMAATRQIGCEGVKVRSQGDGAAIGSTGYDVLQ